MIDGELLGGLYDPPEGPITNIKLRTSSRFITFFIYDCITDEIKNSDWSYECYVKRSYCKVSKFYFNNKKLLTLLTIVRLKANHYLEELLKFLPRLGEVEPKKFLEN